MIQNQFFIIFVFILKKYFSWNSMIFHNIVADLNFNDFSRPAGTLLENNSFRSKEQSGMNWNIQSPPQ